MHFLSSNEYNYRENVKRSSEITIFFCFHGPGQQWLNLFFTPPPQITYPSAENS